MTTRPKRPRDVNQLAKLIVDLSTGEAKDIAETERVVAGRSGGLKGGAARAKKLSAEQRSDIARLAAQARWKKLPN